jgi:hypothetical protein
MRIQTMKAMSLAWLLATLFAWPATGQEQEQEQGPTPEQEKQAELVQRIQEGMKKIDENLLGARTKGVKEGLEENIENIEKLLENTRNLSSQVIGDLDELIKSIKYRKGG